jgi:predicted metal-dependent hydrolase
MSASEADIAAKIKKRAGWIIKQQTQFSAYPPVMPERRYKSGENLRYLGRQYRLSINQTIIEQVRLIHGRLIVDV